MYKPVETGPHRDFELIFHYAREPSSTTTTMNGFGDVWRVLSNLENRLWSFDPEAVRQEFEISSSKFSHPKVPCLVYVSCSTLKFYPCNFDCTHVGRTALQPLTDVMLPSFLFGE